MVFAASVPSVGSLAPEFTLTSQEGTPVSLKDYRGKWVVLYFYPKDFTSGCTDRGAQLPARPAAVPAEECSRAWRQRR